ncbi:MAG: hypothetical protein ACI8PZ_000248 [Myxococcota bacterium]|jgi:hypothetical protein
MRSPSLVPILVLAGCASTAAQPVAASLGEPAPAFSLTATDGTTWSLADHADETVVLEWFNPGCPFVVYGHGDEAGPLRTLASSVSDEVTWVAINSGAPGKQGHGVEANVKAAKDWSMDHPILIDEDGAIGRLYGAATTPHMYVIHKGELVYRGAVDNKPLGKGDGALVNHVVSALSDLKAGQPVVRPETKAYGCSVKY